MSLVISQDGEELSFPKVSRTDSGAYLCIATNGVPPSVSKRITLDVECEWPSGGVSWFIHLAAAFA